MAEIDDILRNIRLFRRTASDEGFDKLLGALVAALRRPPPEPRIKRSPESPDPEPAAVDGPWLYRRSEKARAHMWTGADTICRMAKMGGLGHNWEKKYTVHAIVARTRFVKIACTCPRGDKKKTAEDWGNLGGQ